MLGVKGLLAGSYEGGIDSYTVFMLHGDGADGGTTFTDSSASGHTVVSRVSCTTVTAVKKFGTASIAFQWDPNGISWTDSVDFTFGKGNFTIDFWMYNNASFSQYEAVFSDRQGSGSFYYSMVFWLRNDNKLQFSWYDTSHTIYSCSSNAVHAENEWVHYAVVRNGAELAMYVNGVKQTATANVGTSTQYDTGVAFYMGQDGAYDDYHFESGYIDEFRISKGIARWTADFTPPTAAYS